MPRDRFKVSADEESGTDTVNTSVSATVGTQATSPSSALHFPCTYCGPRRENQFHISLMYW
jgi:hypothetical protein